MTAFWVVALCNLVEVDQRFNLLRRDYLVQDSFICKLSYTFKLFLEDIVGV
jgi:hypothetical protein